jgi:phospholipase D1/2
MALLRPGENCWRIEEADRVAFLVDGAAYFEALREAFRRARHSIVALCWDIDSRVCMVRGTKQDGDPAELGEFLRTLLAQHRGLHAYLLTWDFHMIYAFERGLCPAWLRWFPIRLGTRRRLHFHMDDGHPVWACHHQKLIVVDDQVAILGGLDPTKNRWDTPEHSADDPRRVDPDVGAYAPFHDVQVMVSGRVARALGELARDRWHRATGEEIPAVDLQASQHDVWPETVSTDLISVPVAIARTQPAFDGKPEIREIERLILDAIRSARRHMYIESQYLTSESVAAALVSRLQESTGPDIVVIVHPNSTGWLEQHTMDVLRARVLRRIRSADRYGRLGVYYPDIPGLGEGCMTMHSKLMIVDDEFARIGSANLSNRSMGFDTECDVALEARGEGRIRRAIADLRHRLLAEHLGVDREKVTERLAATGSLLKAVEDLRGQGRTLKVFDHDIPPEVDAWIPDATVIDPDRPLEAQVFAEQFVPKEQRKPARRRVVTATMVLLGLVALAAAWRWTPLRDWLDVPALVDYLSAFRNSAAGPLLVLGGYVIGALAIMPVTMLIAVTVLAFGPWLGFPYSLTGILLSAAVTYGIGHLLGQRWVRRLAGARLNRLSQRLAQRGVLAVMAVRIIPVAPFTIVNLVAGASHIRFRDFLLGTAIGILPGLLGMTVFMDRLLETLRHPGPAGIAVMVVVVAGIVGAAVMLRRWLEKRTRPDEGLSSRHKVIKSSSPST